MRVLLVQLSDIHVKSAADPILARAGNIVDAIKNLDHEIDLAVVAVTGDLAFSGKTEEYAHVWRLLGEVRAGLEAKLGLHTTVPVRVAAVPGNHDVDFARDDEVRAILLDSVYGHPERARAKSVVNGCTKVQDPFFEALNAHASDGRHAGTNGFHERLYYEYRFAVGAENVRLLCMNMAWLSRLHEVQGKLFFPAEAIPDVEADDSLVVGMFHHNINWVEANAARTFREKVESVADVILSGHEHMSSRRTQDVSTGAHNTVLEGPVLQESGSPSNSGFQVLVLDTRTRKQRFTRLSWDGTRYAPVEGGIDADWTDFQVNRYRRRNTFDLSSPTRAYLADPGITLTHRDRGTVTLPDIFVYPDLREMILNPDAPGRLVGGDSVLDLVRSSTVLLITGADQSGKTALAKSLTSDLHSAGEVPVLLEATPQTPTDDRLNRTILRAFEAQYSPQVRTAYEQLDRERRTLIVDDYHKIDRRGRRGFVHSLAQFAAHVILISDDLTLETEELLRPGGGEQGAERYAILPLSYSRRGRLVDQWLSLGGEGHNTSEFEHRLADIERKLDTIFGHNFVPVYPVFILSVLQAAEAATSMDMTASTHGYFYEVFIRAALAQGRQDEGEFDIVLSFLAYLAYALFIRRVRQLDESELREVHQAFVGEYDVDHSFDRFITDLVRRRVLEQRGADYRFKYRFLYYYFVALYLSRHIGEQPIRDHIRNLSRLLHVEEYANILLFLAHLSNDPLIIGEMLTAGHAFYVNLEPASFQQDVLFVGELQGRVVHVDRNADAYRQELREQRDTLSGAPDSVTDGDWRDWQGAPPEDLDLARIALDPISELNAALKTLQILGQVLKNFPGSIQGNRKEEITRACFELGLRAATSILTMVQQVGDELLLIMIEAIREGRPRVDAHQAEIEARETLAGLLHGMGLGMIQRIALSVGSARLGLTYRRVLRGEERPSVQLIDAAISLDQVRGFPESKVRELGSALKRNPYAKWILQQLVVQHFYIFTERQELRQAICSALDIDYKQIRGLDPNRKVIARAPTRRRALPKPS
jgi:hypothetical protein